MKFIGLDTETTGFKYDKGHRIVEFVGLVWDTDEKTYTDKLELLINPERTIPPGAAKVHGITLDMVRDKPIWKDVAQRIWDFIDSADMVVAHNGIKFDIPFLNASFGDVSIAQVKKPVFDTMSGARWATPSGKLPNLREFCFACNVEYDKSKAHRALYDVEVMMESFLNAKEWGWVKDV